MDTSDLKDNSSAYLIQNRTTAGERKAAIINLDSVGVLGGYTITKGYLHNMGEDYFTIESGYKLSNNLWVGQAESTYQLNDDTYIYDNVVQNNVITADHFAESRYKPYTYTWPNYSTANYGKEFHVDDEYHKDYTNYRYSYNYHEHMLLYTVADENGNAVGINIFAQNDEEFKPDKVHTEFITEGQVKSIDSGNYLITIDKRMELNSLNQKWEYSATDKAFDTSRAVVLRDGKSIDIDELTTEDRVYIVAENGSAVLILAE
jgi:hypothetical protein